MRITTIFSLILLLLLVGCGKKPPISDPSLKNDKALLVGINKYKSAPLRGCVNDVNDMKKYLIEVQGFKESDIVMLTDNEATTKNIREKLDWFVKDSKPGDRRLFHYSGHGAEYPGIIDNQPNNINQIICPVDFNWTPETMIMDVEFVSIFKEMPNGVCFNWISDSCFSGDLTRDIKNKAKTYPIMPADIKLKLDALKLGNVRSRGMVNGILDVGYISGCRYDQTSADTEVNGRPCGALTHYLLKNLYKFGQTDIVLNIVATTRDELRSDFYTQEPQAEGARVIYLFLK